MHLNKFDKSLNCINRALELDPNNPEFLSLKGWILHMLNRNKESIHTFEQSTALNKKTASTWMNFGNVLFDIRRHKQAIEKYDRVLEITESQPALYYQGICFLETGQEKKAIENFDLILKNSSDDSHTLLQKAIVLYNQKHYSDSLKILEKIEEDWVKNISYLELRSLVLYELNQIDKAIEWVKKSLSIEPKFASGWYNLACYSAKQNLNPESLSALKRAIELDSSFVKVAKTEKDFDSIKSTKEFQGHIKNMKKKKIRIKHSRKNKKEIVRTK